MTRELPEAYLVDKKIGLALAAGQAVVALESTVITHGLPYPQNLDLARGMEAQVIEHGAVPATIALVKGKIRVGLSGAELEELAQGAQMHKISTRDMGPAAALGWSGGTTVASTMLAAQTAGIQVFATGGIGGVHRQAPFDVSADLPALAKTPVIVVCAGAKAILDIPATLEYLETHSTPVVGYQTDEFPAFYSTSSGLPVQVRADTVDEIVQIAIQHWKLGLNSGILVTVPPPVETALPHETVDAAIQTALQEAQASGVRGQQVTPFLLGRVKELTSGASLQANLALLLNNARVAAQIAVHLASNREK